MLIDCSVLVCYNTNCMFNLLFQGPAPIQTLPGSARGLDQQREVKEIFGYFMVAEMGRQVKSEGSSQP